MVAPWYQILGLRWTDEWNKFYPIRLSITTVPERIADAEACDHDHGHWPWAPVPFATTTIVAIRHAAEKNITVGSLESLCHP